MNPSARSDSPSLPPSARHSQMSYSVALSFTETATVLSCYLFANLVKRVGHLMLCLRTMITSFVCCLKKIGSVAASFILLTMTGSYYYS